MESRKLSSTHTGSEECDADQQTKSHDIIFGLSYYQSAQIKALNNDFGVSISAKKSGTLLKEAVLNFGETPDQFSPNFSEDPRKAITEIANPICKPFHQRLLVVASKSNLHTESLQLTEKSQINPFVLIRAILLTKVTQPLNTYHKTNRGTP